jgi:hypothetical protein
MTAKFTHMWGYTHAYTLTCTCTHAQTHRRTNTCRHAHTLYGTSLAPLHLLPVHADRETCCTYYQNIHVIRGSLNLRVKPVLIYYFITLLNITIERHYVYFVVLSIFTCCIRAVERQV